MKIMKVTATAASRRWSNPIRGALQLLDIEGGCTITIETSEGMTGRSHVFFGRGEASAAVLVHPVNDALTPAIVGEDAFLIRGVRDKLWKLTDYHGTLGLTLFGLAGIDIAVWDLMGRALEQSVWRLLGAHRDRVPAYAMVGWLNDDLDTLRRVCTKAMEQAFVANQVFSRNSRASSTSRSPQARTPTAGASSARCSSSRRREAFSPRC